MKLFLSACLVAVLIGVIAFAGALQFTSAQSGTTVPSMIISSNTTWTQADSPYTLMGPVDVTKGVTLTIDAGVTINLGSSPLNDLNVDGTLNAQGSSTDNIIFTNNAPNNAPSIIFDENSIGTIENAIFDDPSIQSLNGASMIINNCVFKDGSGITAEGVNSPTTITNNYISGSVSAEDATISNNTILHGITLPADPYSTSIISGNNITNPGGTVVLLYWEGTISGNIISGGSTGIDLENGDTIQRNLIVNNGVGISIDPAVSGGIIENNTIANNSGGGIMYANNITTISYNNLENNGVYNLVSSRYAVNATYNWWGTADTQVINQTIDDNKNDYNLGTVTFVPFLTAPNLEAPAITTPIPPLTPTSTPSPTSATSAPSPVSVLTPTPIATSTQLPSSSTQNPKSIYEILIATLVILIIAFAVVIAVFRRGKRR